MISLGGTKQRGLVIEALCDITKGGYLVNHECYSQHVKDTVCGGVFLLLKNSLRNLTHVVIVSM